MNFIAMQSYVIDSSVFIKLFLPEEEDSDKALRLMDRIIDERLNILAPRIFYYAVFGIARKIGIPTAAIWGLLQDCEGSLLAYINEDAATTRKTLSICNHGNAKSGFPTFYDGSYHALAILNNCDFVTADRRHYEKTKALGHVRLLADMNVT